MNGAGGTSVRINTRRGVERGCPVEWGLVAEGELSKQLAGCDVEVRGAAGVREVGY